MNTIIIRTKFGDNDNSFFYFVILQFKAILERNEESPIQDRTRPETNKKKQLKFKFKFCLDFNKLTKVDAKTL